MRAPRGSRRLVLVPLVAAVALVLAQGVLTPATAGTGGGRAAGTASRVAPAAVGELDCNGLSPIQKPVKPAVMCKDPRGSDEGRTAENGHYIGHDAPSVRFISTQPGSGSDTPFGERLPRDPVALPTVKTPGKDVTHWFELSVAPWFSTTVCDPNSAPLTPCTPRSDANAPKGRYLGGGQAFVELQFYAPGFGPFIDSISCDNTHWCAALTIDS